MKDVAKLALAAGVLWLLVLYGGFTGQSTNAEQPHSAPAVASTESPPAAVASAGAASEAPSAATREDRPAPAAGARKKPIAKRFVVYFDFDSATVTEDGLQTIRQALAFARTVKASHVGLAGFTDRAGPDGYNMALSERRAGTVADALRGLDIGALDLNVEAYGEKRLAVHTADGMADQRNRRVEIFVSA